MNLIGFIYKKKVKKNLLLKRGETVDVDVTLVSVTLALCFFVFSFLYRYYTLRNC